MAITERGGLRHPRHWCVDSQRGWPATAGVPDGGGMVIETRRSRVMNGSCSCRGRVGQPVVAVDEVRAAVNEQWVRGWAVEVLLSPPADGDDAPTPRQPHGQAQRLFAAVARLPRSEQRRILSVLGALVAQAEGHWP